MLKLLEGGLGVDSAASTKVNHDRLHLIREPVEQSRPSTSPRFQANLVATGHVPLIFFFSFPHLSLSASVRINAPVYRMVGELIYAEPFVARVRKGG